MMRKQQTESKLTNQNHTKKYENRIWEKTRRIKAIQRKD